MRFLKKLKSGNFWVSIISAGVLIAEVVFDFEIKTEYLNQILLGILGLLTMCGIVTDHGEKETILQGTSQNENQKQDSPDNFSNIKSICDTISLMLNKVSINSNTNNQNFKGDKMDNENFNQSTNEEIAHDKQFDDLDNFQDTNCDNVIDKNSNNATIDNNENLTEMPDDDVENLYSDEVDTIEDVVENKQNMIDINVDKNDVLEKIDNSKNNFIQNIDNSKNNIVENEGLNIDDMAGNMDLNNNMTENINSNIDNIEDIDVDTNVDTINNEPFLQNK